MQLYIQNEIIKLIALKKIYLGFLAGIMFAAVFLIFFKTDGGYARTVYDAVKDILDVLEASNFYVFVLGFCAFIYSVEFEAKTMKIIRAKPISLLGFLSGKYLACIIYTFVFYAVLLLFTLLLSSFLFELSDFTDYKQQAVIAVAEGLKYSLTAYFFQAYVSIFAVALVLFFSILFENGIIALILALFLLLTGSIFGKKYFIYNFLPQKYLEISPLIYTAEIAWAAVFFYCAVITGFILVLFAASYLILRKKEVLV